MSPASMKTMRPSGPMPGQRASHVSNRVCCVRSFPSGVIDQMFVVPPWSLRK
ncbi:MAG: hypothetical protein U0166_08575 [Acidobacteriota bacterium]